MAQQTSSIAEKAVATPSAASPSGFTTVHDFFGFAGNGRGLRLNVYLRPPAVEPRRLIYRGGQAGSRQTDRHPVMRAEFAGLGR